VLCRVTLLIFISLIIALSVRVFPHQEQPAPPGVALNYYRSEVDGTWQPYGVYVPTSYAESAKHPVVFHLHGFGGRFSPPNAWQQQWANEHRWILVSLDGRGNQNWDLLGEEDVFAVLADLRKRYSIDEDRLYLEGCSMGGHGCYRLALRFPDVFAAAAPVAGWTTYTEFYPHWYEPAAAPRWRDGYVDLSRQPLLETASSLFWAENGRHTNLFIVFDRNDPTNPATNAEQMMNRLNQFGYPYQMRVGNLGHCGSYDAQSIYQFFANKRRVVRPNDVIFTTNHLQFNKAYWVQIDRLKTLNRWARVEAFRHGNNVSVRTQNVAQYTLLLDESPIRKDTALIVTTNGETTFRGVPPSQLTFAVETDEQHRVLGWTQRTPQLVEESPQHSSQPRLVGEASSHPAKRKGLCGPIAEIFRSPFLVVHGGAGDASNPDWRDAQRFCTDWNAWMNLRWGNEGRFLGAREENWWIPPYPFRVGTGIPPDQPLLTPRPDGDVSEEEIRTHNLILFGDPQSNALIRRWRDKLPIRLSATASGVEAQVGTRTYRGRNVNYVFIAPNPDAPTRCVVGARGYLSSQIDPSRFGANNVGKDLEALPFYWSDYVIWDANRKPAPTVQPPLLYLPETYLEAGFFNDRWQLHATPPMTTATVQGKRNDDGSYAPPVKIALEANDAVGGFGVERVEYRLGKGRWQRYRQPLTFRLKSGSIRLSYRAVGASGQYLYGSVRNRSGQTVRRATGAVENVEITKTLRMTLKNLRQD
jgi:pimeloyl-ACP methyl ester carboxylesterase